jgi:hypothetical protein
MRNPRYFFGTFIFLSLNYLINLTLGWPLLAKSGLKGNRNFSDLSTTLQQVNCGQVTCPEYIYGEFFANMARKLKLIEVPTNLFGSVLALAFIISVSLLASSSLTRIGLIAINLIGISPATLLLIERANIDILVFVLCMLASRVSKERLSVLSVSFLSIATLIKFYPLITLLQQGVMVLKTNVSKMKSIFVLVMVIVTSYFTISNLIKESSDIPANWNASFGFSIGLLWLSFFLREMASKEVFIEPIYFPALGFCLILLVWIFLRLSKEKRFTVTSSALIRDPIFLTGLTCYVLGISFDYRLVFLLIPCARLLNANESLLVSKFLLLMVSSYFTTTNFGISTRFFYPGIQLIGDISLFTLVALSVFDFKTSKNRAFIGRE